MGQNAPSRTIVTLASEDGRSSYQRIIGAVGMAIAETENKRDTD
jgi:hypothetical protein